jgi:hypothetical protein
MLVVVLAACQPMYGASPQRLRTPEPIKPPTTLPGGETATIIYDEDCDLLTAKVPKVTRETKQSEVYVAQGDQKVADFDATPAKTDLIIDGIDEYSAALRKDPFNAKATLKLALAYDKVRRKGCALALLQRLDQLAQNPKFAPEASGVIDEIEQRRKWFGGYRKEALRKLGRTGP